MGLGWPEAPNLVKNPSRLKRGDDRLSPFTLGGGRRRLIQKGRPHHHDEPNQAENQADSKPKQH